MHVPKRWEVNPEFTFFKCHSCPKREDPSCEASVRLTVSGLPSSNTLMALLTSPLQSCRAIMDSSWSLPVMSTSWKTRRPVHVPTYVFKVESVFLSNTIRTSSDLSTRFFWRDLKSPPLLIHYQIKNVPCTRSSTSIHKSEAVFWLERQLTNNRCYSRQEVKDGAASSPVWPSLQSLHRCGLKSSAPVGSAQRSPEEREREGGRERESRQRRKASMKPKLLFKRCRCSSAVIGNICLFRNILKQLSFYF